MPMDRSKYPSNWNEISRRIRFERAGSKCEQCGAPNGEYIMRDSADPSKWRRPEEMPDAIAMEQIASKKVIKVVLTVAHLDHDTLNNDDSNLKALCQRCHLLHDGKQHAQNAAATRRRKHDEFTGQKRLFE